MVGGLGLFLVGLWMLPMFLGSKWVYQPLLDRLRADDFQVTIDSVHLRWFQQLSMSGIRIRQQDGPVLLSVDRIETNQGLLGYLIGGRRLGSVNILSPVVDVELLADTSNLQKLLKAIEGDKSKETAKENTKPAFDLDIHVRGFQAKVKRAESPEPMVVVPAFDLDLVYRGSTQPSELIIAPGKILDHVKLTPELLHLGLGHAVPLLAESAWFDGQISLATERIAIPLDSPIDSTGKAVLTMHQVRSGPSQEAIIDVLDWIAQMRGKETDHEFVFVDGSKIQVEMSNRRVEHTGLQVGLPQLDERLQLATSGRVGIEDRQLALQLKIPLPIEQIASNKAIKSLGVPSLTVPVSGTLKDPKIDWGQLRNESASLLGMIRGQLEGEAPKAAEVVKALEGIAGGDADAAIATAAQVFQQLRSKRKAQRDAQRNSQQDATSGSEAKPKGTDGESKSGKGWRDALRGVLKGTQGNNDQ